MRLRTEELHHIAWALKMAHLCNTPPHHTWDALEGHLINFLLEQTEPVKEEKADD
jgi:hypothetical protein